MSHASPESPANEQPACVCLIGAGTVGRAILEVHLQHRFDVILVDAYQHALQTACDWVSSQFPDHRIESTEPVLAEMPAVRFSLGGGPLARSIAPSIVIESIPENLLRKQALFVELGQRFGSAVVLASNTSNLRIADIFKPLENDVRCCGLHFFMPVRERPLVECVATPTTSPETQAASRSHALRIGKQTLFVQDSPGFVVNRLLAPYLNQSLLMLQYGVEASQLADAAEAFGMPMSPLKLIDTIGLRTAFDSGRVFWQSFPNRLEPASVLPGMLKAKRTRADDRSGFLESDALSPTALRVIASYQRDRRTWPLQEIAAMIAIPMWIEAAELLATEVVSDEASIELAMNGGLGYVRPAGFFAFFDALGNDVMRRHLQSSSRTFRGLCAPPELVTCLDMGLLPRQAAIRYAEIRRSAAR